MQAPAAPAQGGGVDQHATPQMIGAAMQAQFPAFFIVGNVGAEDDRGAARIADCARIHPLNASDENLNGGWLSYCAWDAHGFHDWYCFFDTAYSLAAGRDRVTCDEVRLAKEVTVFRIWIGGPFADPPSNLADFVLNADSYPAWVPDQELLVWSGSIRKFNGGVVLHDYPDPLFRILRNHAFTYVNGVIFDQLELLSGAFYTLRLQICSTEPVRPGSPTKDSSLGGWVDVRAETEEECWWDRAMVIEIKDHNDSPQFCCSPGN